MATRDAHNPASGGVSRLGDAPDALDVPPATPVSAVSAERQRLLSEMLFALAHVIDLHLKAQPSCFDLSTYLVCDQCQMTQLGETLPHLDSCPIGRAEKLLSQLLGTTEQTPQPGKEDAYEGMDRRARLGKAATAGCEYGEPWKVDAFCRGVIRDCNDDLLGYVLSTIAQRQVLPEEAWRAVACVNFCEGIPTDVLEKQLPLASSNRRRWEEIQHLRRALPWLPVLDADAIGGAE